MTRARSVRLGAVGLATLAVLSGASFAAQPEVAVPAPQVAAAGSTVDYSARDARTDRDLVRPTLAPSSATTKAPSAKASTQKAAPKKATAKKATAKKTSTKKAAAEKTATAVGSRYTRVALNVRTSPSETGKLVDVIDTGSKIKIAAKVSGQWQSVVHDGALGWVKKQYLVTSKPKASSTTTSTAGGSSSGGLSSGACASGSSVETGGLTRDAVAVHRAVCAQFPQITSYGGVRADSLPEHPSGRAIDCMLPSYSSASGNALGWQIANWLKGHASQLGISQILFDQHIWTVQRGGEGWRSMSSRGGDTANHRDHVHVTVYGNAS